MLHKSPGNSLHSNDAAATGVSDGPVRLLSRDDLKKLGISYSNPHLLRLEEEGKFPRRLFLSPARVAWVEAEIINYITRCIDSRG